MFAQLPSAEVPTYKGALVTDADMIHDTIACNPVAATSARASVSRERDAENPNADLSYKKITLPLGPNTYRRTYTADTHPPENVNVLYMCSFIKQYCNRMYLR